ncbi:DsbA family oxidoreductase [Streptacidiphilus sp. ASG 303]|uniref:DsbA family oxidoreductase n=1 Tax=Streptacidiphilus sp. ASG 303 TaxID=2896847 RepID=UPI001E2EA3A0|nr:DsbA family oxidoreductase [Streptacidiphilus sp. ASG 303]MCD0486147.1 DsbA family oxidoreductase [Streptacidiphilus sp. ASG 303]
MKVEIYSDIACPWCYVGKRRFERALAAYPGADSVEVVYRPYQLAPDAPTEAEPLEPVLRRKFGDRITEMNARLAEVGRQEGIAFDFASAQSVNTLLGHRLLHLAETEYGAAVQARLKNALLHDYFVDGGNVGDRDRLTRLAAAAGMDEERVAAYLASDEGAAEVREQIAEAQLMGVTAVPTFVFEGRWAVQGAQEASTFLQVLEQVAAQTAAPGGAAEGAGDDACADGSCTV